MDLLHKIYDRLLRIVYHKLLQLEGLEPKKRRKEMSVRKLVIYFSLSMIVVEKIFSLILKPETMKLFSAPNAILMAIISAVGLNLIAEKFQKK